MSRVLLRGPVRWETAASIAWAVGSVGTLLLLAAAGTALAWVLAAFVIACVVMCLLSFALGSRGHARALAAIEPRTSPSQDGSPR